MTEYKRPVRFMIVSDGVALTVSHTEEKKVLAPSSALAHVGVTLESTDYSIKDGIIEIHTFTKTQQQ